MVMELAKLKKPALPVKWDYDESVQKVKKIIYKWKNLTEDMANELWIAREKLSLKPGNQPRNTVGRFRPTDKNWDTYCEDIGQIRQRVNEWLARWFDESLTGKMTGNAENYTPAHIIDKVRIVLGEIDLDPASCAYAQKTVKAKKYYTQENNGLDKTWGGRVFLNPPYGASDIKDFTNKLIDELPNIEAAILLTNDQTDTDWWQKCAINANVIFLPDGRLHFYTPTKEETSPTNGQTFFYYGDSESKFKEIFNWGLLVKVL